MKAKALYICSTVSPVDIIYMYINRDAGLLGEGIWVQDQYFLCVFLFHFYFVYSLTANTKNVQYCNTKHGTVQINWCEPNLLFLPSFFTN